MKFDKEIGPGRKQYFFSEKDDFPLYRKHVFKLANEICSEIKENRHKKVLEIGPSHSLYTESFSDFDTGIIRKTCHENYIHYKTLDIDPDAKCDYTCSIEDLSSITEKFDIIILLGIIEHVRQVWKVPEQLASICTSKAKVYLNTPFMMKVHGPIPDCWRISEYGYEALFGDLFNISKIDTFPENELGKNSIPLSLNVVLELK